MRPRTGPQSLRVALLSEHPLIALGIKQCLAAQHRLHCFQLSTSLAQILKCLANDPSPNVLIVDLSPPTSFSCSTLKDLKAVSPKLPLLVFSTGDESIHAERAIRAGANGYVMERSGCAILWQAIQRVCSGEIYVSPGLAQSLLKSITHSSALPKSALSALSDREMEIFILIGQGKTSGEIASLLHVSGKTLAVHRHHMRKKLKLESPTQLIQFAVCYVQTDAGNRPTAFSPVSES